MADTCAFCCDLMHAEAVVAHLRMRIRTRPGVAKVCMLTLK